MFRFGRKENIEKKKTVSHHEHRAEVQTMLKLIQVVPMDDEIKTIMRMRIWGIKPDFFYPLTHQQIATLCKMDVEHVKAIEEAGKRNCQKYLEQVSTQEAVERFNERAAMYKRNMFGSGWARKRFSV